MQISLLECFWSNTFSSLPMKTLQFTLTGDTIEFPCARLLNATTEYSSDSEKEVSGVLPSQSLKDSLVLPVSSICFDVITRSSFNSTEDFLRLYFRGVFLPMALVSNIPTLPEYLSSLLFFSLTFLLSFVVEPLIGLLFRSMLRWFHISLPISSLFSDTTIPEVSLKNGFSFSFAVNDNSGVVSPTVLSGLA